MHYHTRQILVIDDDSDDVLLLEECLSHTSLDFKISAIHKGREAVPHIHQLSSTFPASRPDLIILDIQLPDLDGVEVIQAIRRDPILCTIPIMAYTGLEDEQRISACYAAGVNCCIKKPSNIEEATKLAQAIEEFWFSTLRLPGDYDR